MQPQDILRQKQTHLENQEVQQHVNNEIIAAREGERATIEDVIVESYTLAEAVSDFIHEEVGVRETSARNGNRATTARTERGDVISHRSRITRIRDRVNKHERGATTRNESFIGIESFTTSTSNLIPLGEIDPDAEDKSTHAYVEFFVEEENVPELTTSVVLDRPKTKKTKLGLGDPTKVGFRLFVGPANAMEQIAAAGDEEEQAQKRREVLVQINEEEDGMNSAVTLPVVPHSAKGQPIQTRLESLIAQSSHYDLVEIYAPDILTTGPPVRVEEPAVDRAGRPVIDPRTNTQLIQTDVKSPDADAMTLFLNGHLRQDELHDKLAEEAADGPVHTRGLQEKIDSDTEALNNIEELLFMAQEHIAEQQRLEEERLEEEERQRELERIRQELARQAEEDAAQNPIPRGPDPGTPHSPPWA